MQNNHVQAQTGHAVVLELGGPLLDPPADPAKPGEDPCLDLPTRLTEARFDIIENETNIHVRRVEFDFFDAANMVGKRRRDWSRATRPWASAQKGSAAFGRVERWPDLVFLPRITVHNFFQIIFHAKNGDPNGINQDEAENGSRAWKKKNTPRRIRTRDQKGPSDPSLTLKTA